jgi:hypothetical protein
MRTPHRPNASAVPDEMSYQAHRMVIGVIGLLLPGLLILFAGVLPTEGLTDWELLDSVSAYYYTGAMGIFVGMLFALSLFLFTYRGYVGVVADRFVGRVGGLAALLVAFCPTKAPGSLKEPIWWSRTTSIIHYTAAVVLFGSFILFSIWLFRKSNIPIRRDRPPEKRYRDNVCLACGLIMIVCVLVAAVSSWQGRSIFWPEAIAILAFSISWLAKAEAHKLVLGATKRLRRLQPVPKNA